MNADQAWLLFGDRDLKLAGGGVVTDPNLVGCHLERKFFIPLVVPAVAAKLYWGGNSRHGQKVRASKLGCNVPLLGLSLLLYNLPLF